MARKIHSATKNRNKEQEKQNNACSIHMQVNVPNVHLKCNHDLIKNILSRIRIEGNGNELRTI